MMQRRIQDNHKYTRGLDVSSKRRGDILSPRYRILPLLVLSALTIHLCASVAPARENVPPATTQPATSSVEDEKIPAEEKEPSSDPYGAWVQLLLALVIVVGLIVALGWLLKRLGGGKTFRGAGTLKLIARANLSPKHQMFLVRMGRRLVLIGAGPQGLATLSEITDAEEANKLLQAAGIKSLDAEGGSE